MKFVSWKACCGGLLLLLALAACQPDESVLTRPRGQGDPGRLGDPGMLSDPARLGNVDAPDSLSASAEPTPFRPLRPTQPGGQESPSGDLAASPGDPAFVLGQGADKPAPTPVWLTPLPPRDSSPPVPNTAGAAVSSEPSLEFYGIDFGSRQKVTLTIYPPKGVNRGKPIKIAFIPAERCRFGQKTGCVYAYKPSYPGNVLVVTVHSGVGGEGQRLRSALEGTGINRAAFSLNQVQQNLAALQGARVTISQGDHAVDSAQVAAFTRIPARTLARYFKAPLSEVLGIAGDLDPALAPWAIPEQPVIVLETCGWKMPGEKASGQVSDTTGSVYLGVITGR